MAKKKTSEDIRIELEAKKLNDKIKAIESIDPTQKIKKLFK